MADGEQQDNASSQGEDVDVNGEIIAAIKKVQSDMETLKSDNENFKKELSTMKSKTKTATKGTVNSVLRKLNIDEADDARDRNKSKDGGAIVVEENGRIIKDGTGHDNKENDKEIDDEHEKRRRRHKRSCSQGYVHESVQQELREVRDLIQCILGVPKPLEKETPTSYADFPFLDNIVLVEIPKKCIVPNMKFYDGTTDSQEHVA